MIARKKIPPTFLPLDIVYEDEDIIVINKPAGMPIHPSMNNYTNSMANALAWYYQQQNNLSFSGAVIVLTEIRPVSPLLRNILSAEIFYPAGSDTD